MQGQSKHSVRHGLPNRRQNETHEIEIEGQDYCVTLGYYPDAHVHQQLVNNVQGGSLNAPQLFSATTSTYKDGGNTGSGGTGATHMCGVRYEVMSA